MRLIYSHSYVSGPKIGTLVPTNPAIEWRSMETSSETMKWFERASLDAVRRRVKMVVDNLSKR